MYVLQKWTLPQSYSYPIAQRGKLNHTSRMVSCMYAWGAIYHHRHTPQVYQPAASPPSMPPSLPPAPPTTPYMPQPLQSSGPSPPTSPFSSVAPIAAPFVQVSPPFRSSDVSHEYLSPHTRAEGYHVEPLSGLEPAAAEHVALQALRTATKRHSIHPMCSSLQVALHSCFHCKNYTWHAPLLL